MQTEIVLSQIFMLALAVLIGAIAAKLKVITEETKDMLSKVIFNISLPLMLFTSFSRIEATPRLIGNSITVLVLSCIVYIIFFLVGWLTGKLFRVDGQDSAVFKVHSMFGNTIFLGFPLVYALYGKEGTVYAGMFQFISSIVMWTAGVIMLAQGNGTSWKKSIVNVVNPNTVAMVIGMMFSLLQIKLPQIITRPLAELGSANTWLSMLYIGAMLAFSNVGSLLKRKSIYIASFNRLLLAPALLIFLFYLSVTFDWFVPDKLVSSVIVLESSMPCMASVVIIAKEFGSDDRLAVGNVFVATILSIFTLPFVVMALGRFL